MGAGILAWALRNPLATGLGIAVLLLSIALGVQTVRLALAQSSLATEKLAFSDFKKDLAEQTAKAERENAARSSAKAEALANDYMQIQTTASEVKEALNAAKSTGACERDPKWRATVGGVQRIGQGSAGAAPGKAD